MAVNVKCFVVDSSFVLSALLPDEGSLFATNIFNKFSSGEYSLISCLLLPYEIANGIKLALIRKRIDMAEAENLVEKFLKLNIRLCEVETMKLFETAVSENITIYDAAYLLVSRDTNYPLLSLDKHLKGYSSGFSL
mgnify:CR=1 FL=1